jgi:dipeptidase E
MKIYASSFRLCADPIRLRNLFADSTRVAVISNALDFSSDVARRDRGVAGEVAALSGLGLEPKSVDLRDYFGDRGATQRLLEGFDGVWVLGGNAFTLRRAFRYSGLDQLLNEMAMSNVPFVYAGYSAGSCVLGPTLDGIHLVDPPELPAEGYETQIIWEGLGLLPFSIAPHFKSDHPESAMIDGVVEYFEARGLPYRTLRDGESIVIPE